MATYINKNMIDGVEELPRLTEEEFLAIPVAERPKIWVKRNATETDRGITAEDVEYDNTSSGLSATDTQGAIDEVVSNSQWKLLANKTMSAAGSLGVAIPSDASELYFDFLALGVQLNVVTKSLTTTGKYFQNGYYLTSSNASSVAVEISKYNIGYFTDTRNGGSFVATEINIYYKS